MNTSDRAFENYVRNQLFFLVFFYHHVLFASKVLLSISLLFKFLEYKLFLFEGRFEHGINTVSDTVDQIKLE